MGVPNLHPQFTPNLRRPELMGVPEFAMRVPDFDGCPELPLMGVPNYRYPEFEFLLCIFRVVAGVQVNAFVLH